jgi:hypothetical protein
MPWSVFRRFGSGWYSEVLPPAAVDVVPVREIAAGLIRFLSPRPEAPVTSDGRPLMKVARPVRIIGKADGDA